MLTDLKSGKPIYNSESRKKEREEEEKERQLQNVKPYKWT